MPDIVLTRLNQDAIELYCNCNESDTYNIFKYTIDNDVDMVTSIDLELKPDIYLDMMKTGRYSFWCENEIGEKSEKFNLNFKEQSKREYFDKICPNRNDKENYIINSIDSRDYMVELYKKFLEAENETEKKTVAKILNLVIFNMNEDIRKFNWNNNGIDLRCNKSYIFDIDFSLSNNMFLYGTATDIEFASIDMRVGNTLKYEWNLLNGRKYNSVKDKIVFNINPGLYRVKLYSYGEVARYFYFFASGLENRNEAFRQELKVNQQKKENKIPKYDFDLPEAIAAENPDLVETIATLDIFNAPRLQMFQNLLVYQDKYEEALIAEVKDIYNFSEDTGIKLYLTCYSEEDYVKPEYSPIMIGIDSSRIKIDKDMRARLDIVFYNEKYYFRIEDDNRNIVSNTCVVDLNNIVDKVPYNDIYNSLFYDTITTKLYEIINKDRASREYWNTIKEVVDRYKHLDNRSFKDITEYIIESMIEREMDLGAILPSILDFDFIYRKEKDRNFFNKQISKKSYWTHVIPEGDYIVKIIEISKKKLDVEYIYDPNKAQEIYYRNSDYMIIQLIDPKTYKRSGWTLYDNVTNPNITIKKHESSLEVEIINGL